MAELSDLVVELKQVNKNLTNPIQSSGDKESAAEKSRADAELKGIFTGILDTLKGGMGKAAATDKKQGGIIASVLGGLGSGLGALGKGVGKLGVGFAKGLIALGAGISGFMLALGATSVLLGLMGADGKALKTLISNFFGAFDAKAAGMMGGIILAAATIVQLKVPKIQFMKAMTALGAGLAGFFLGIMAADGFAKVGAALTLDGSSLKKLMSNFFGAFDGVGAAMLLGIVGIAGVVAKLEVDPIKLVKGMTAIGAGLAGFFLGIMAADGFATIGAGLSLDGSALKTLMGNFFGAFSQAGMTGVAVLGSILLAGSAMAAGKVKAKDIVGGMSAIGAGLAGFFLGILAADGFATIGAGLGVTGESLKTLMANFFGAFSQAGMTGVAVLGAILLAGSAMAAGKVKAKDIVGGMTAVGAGLAGFFLGILAAEGFAKMGNAAGLDGSNLKTLINNFVGAFQETSTAGLIAVGALLAVGAGIGATLGAKGAVGVALGMTGIGAGMAGFFGGLMLADKFAATLGTDIPGAKLSIMMKNFMSAFDGASDAGLIALGALLVVGAGLGVASPAVALSAALGMTAVGAGLAGFFGGLMLADKFAETLGTDVPGAKLATMMKNFTGALSSMDETSLKVMGTLLVAGAAIGVLLGPGGAAMVAIGMTALGAGLGGFFAGLMLADVAISKLGGEDAGAGIATLLTNLGKGLGGFVGGFGESMAKQLESLNADKLSKLGQGIKDLGVGILAFAGGQGVGAVTGLMSKIGSLFGSDSPLEQIAEFSRNIKDEEADRLAKLGIGIGGLGKGLLSLSQADPKSIEKTLATLSQMKDLPSMVGIDTTPFAAFPMKSMQEGGIVQETGPILAHKDEIIFDQQASGMMVRAAQLMADSGAMKSTASNGGGQPVIINNNNVDNSMQSSQTTAVSIPAPTRSNESTLRALQAA